ncbi:uncharacterized protein LOC111907938 [Lactuca sativa]|uniref:uncharacterized protein LOC111907938 n=1 Tax=Lactuca sativa TaxID=4236 RepID=UPI000CD972D7|nr:uncharacterized protein LOC111907938 [Lactuca sativa]
MDSFTSSNSIKPSSVTDPSFSYAGGNNENELNPEMASRLKKQSPTKNFMSHTICTTNKATVLKKKILGERNETLDVNEQPSLQRSSSFESKSVKSPVVVDHVQKPYDPVNNYLSPRPKFLRYNPNRRRMISVLHGNEESVRSSNSFEAPGMELGADSYGFVDSCSQKEEQTLDLINNEGECEEEDEEGESQEEEEEDEEEEEEEEIEFGDDERFWNLKGFLKFIAVVIAVIYTTQAICSMDSPTPFHTVETWSNVYGVSGLNFSQVGSCSLMETELVVGRLKEVDIVGVHDDEEETSDSLQELGADIDLENDEADVIHGEMWKEDEDLDENDEIAEEMVAIYDVEGEREVDDDDQTLVATDSDENEEIAEQEMEEINDSEIETETIQSESFDLNLVGVIGFFMLILTSSFGVMYSRRMKSSPPVTPTVAGANHEAEKEEIRVLEQEDHEEEESPLMKSTPLQKDVSEEHSHIHPPSVELLGEFVFGESNSLIQSTIFSGETKASHIENSTGDSVVYNEKTIKKQRRKIEPTTVVTPSPMRRSSRLQNRSIKSP